VVSLGDVMPFDIFLYVSTWKYWIYFDEIGFCTYSFYISHIHSLLYKVCTNELYTVLLWQQYELKDTGVKTK
jgi:hypothetical protein